MRKTSNVPLFICSKRGLSKCLIYDEDERRVNTVVINRAQNSTGRAFRIWKMRSTIRHHLSQSKQTIKDCLVLITRVSGRAASGGPRLVNSRLLPPNCDVPTAEDLLLVFSLYGR